MLRNVQADVFFFVPDLDAHRNVDYLHYGKGRNVMLYEQRHGKAWPKKKRESCIRSLKKRFRVK